MIGIKSRNILYQEATLQPVFTSFFNIGGSFLSIICLSYVYAIANLSSLFINNVSLRNTNLGSLFAERIWPF